MIDLPALHFHTAEIDLIVFPAIRAVDQELSAEPVLQVLQQVTKHIRESVMHALVISSQHRWWFDRIVRLAAAKGPEFPAKQLDKIDHRDRIADGVQDIAGPVAGAVACVMAV